MSRTAAEVVERQEAPLVGRCLAGDARRERDGGEQLVDREAEDSREARVAAEQREVPPVRPETLDERAGSADGVDPSEARVERRGEERQIGFVDLEDAREARADARVRRDRPVRVGRGRKEPVEGRYIAAHRHGRQLVDERAEVVDGDV